MSFNQIPQAITRREPFTTDGRRRFSLGAAGESTGEIKEDANDSGNSDLSIKKQLSPSPSLSSPPPPPFATLDDEEEEQTTSNPRRASKRGDRSPRQGKDDLEEEVSHIFDDREVVKRGKRSGISRKDDNVFLAWLKDVYYQIFWQGLDFGDEDDEYIEEIEWLDSEAAQQDAWSWESKGSSGFQKPVFRGAFPFDKQKFPPARQKNKTAPMGSTSSSPSTSASAGPTSIGREAAGLQDGVPLWRNLRPRVQIYDDIDDIDDHDDDDDDIDGRSDLYSRKGTSKNEAKASQRGCTEDLTKARNELEEQRSVLMVSKEVWRRRIADMLRTASNSAPEGEMGEEGDVKLRLARARLQEINDEMADINMELREIKWATKVTADGVSRAAALNDRDDL